MSGEHGVRPVVVTRAENADGPLSRELRSLGLEVLSWPAVSVTAADSGALDEALSRLDRLCVRNEKWVELADVLARQIKENNKEDASVGTHVLREWIGAQMPRPNPY